jgi:putative chitinase
MNSLFTADQWDRILRGMGVSVANAAKWASVCEQYLVEASFNLGKQEIDDFLAQIVHESARFSRVEESLHYTTPERIMAVWPSRFPTVASAQPFVRNPRALAEKVYAGRMGNDWPGDGWTYRGRSPIMLTGKEAYELAQTETGLPLVDFPDMAKLPAAGMKISIAWWERRIPDAFINNVDLVSRRVNGGVNGLAERRYLAGVANALLQERHNTV